MKRILALTFLAFTLFGFSLAEPVLAATEVEKQLLPTSPFYLLVKVKESIQQLLTFNLSSEAKLLEGFTDQRIEEMGYASFSNDNTALGLSLDRYQAQKTLALEYAEKANDSSVVDQIKEGALEQQKAMTKMQLDLEGSEGVQQHIVEVQKEVAGEIKNTVEIVQGTEEAAEMDEKTHYIWLDPNVDASGELPSLPDELVKWEYAPGTEGRDEGDRVIEVTFAPGTEVGGDAGNKLQIQWAPGTEGGGEGAVVYDEGPTIVVAPGGGSSSSGGNEKIEIEE